jgi:cystathionine beta-lyase
VTDRTTGGSTKASEAQGLGFSTRLVRFDAAPGDPSHPVATPIYQTATFAQESPLEFGAYDYSRSGNPTRTVLESQLATLDRATHALAYVSGVSAMSGVFGLLRPGDRVIASDDLYGGTYRLFAKVLQPRGITVEYVDLASGDIESLITPGTRLVHVESPTNPQLRIIDLRRVAIRCRDVGAILCVDATVMSPYLCRPLELGADLVVHSATKYLCGHSDVTAGVITTRRVDLAQELAFLRNAEGTALPPFDSAMLLRGLKTLSIRLDRQQTSAAKVAAFLASHAGVAEVLFPGLESHPGRTLHESQASGPGALVSFRPRGGTAENAAKIIQRLKLCTISVSFGSVSSSVCLPGHMSHKSIPEEVRKRRGFPEDLIRLSIGIEDAEDLIADLQRALAGV